PTFLAALVAETQSSDGSALYYEGRQAYPGAAPFDERTAALFFGRSSDLAEAQRWADSGTKWLDIKGASGIGKTSFIFGALIPAVRRGQLHRIPEDVRIITLRPDSDVAESANLDPKGRVLLIVEDWDRIEGGRLGQAEAIRHQIAGWL